MNIMFMGTPEFACVSLEKLVNSGYTVSSVVTTEDKPRGRGHKMTPPAVFECAKNLGIENVYQPVNLKKENFEDILLNEKPDMIVVVAYGKLLPKYVIDYPKYGCINVHGSLLPKYRGAAPMQWALIDGEEETGVTTMYMDTGLDTGDMLLKSVLKLSMEDDFGVVHDKLAVMGADLLTETIDKIESATIERTPQGETTTHYAHMITKEMTYINWNDDALKIANLIRGLTPVPKASAVINGKNFKILKALPVYNKKDAPCGAVVSVNDDSFDVACANGSLLRIYTIQPEGKKPMSVSEYLKGNKIDLN